MISTIVRVQLEKDGTLKLPPHLWQELGIEPPREIELFMRIPEQSRRVPRALSLEERARFDRAAELLRASYQDADMDMVWKEIEQGRRDRWS